MEKLRENLISDKYSCVRKLRSCAAFVLSLAAAIFIWRLSPGVGAAVIIISAMLFIADCFFLTPFWFRSLECCIMPDHIFVRKGVWRKKYIRILFPGIQYCIVSRTPLQRIYGLCTLTILCAGASERIAGLELRDAEKISIASNQAIFPERRNR